MCVCVCVCGVNVYRGLVNLLGNKGANLAEMSNLGIKVPAGFTLTTAVSDEYNAQGKKLAANVMSEVCVCVYVCVCLLVSLMCVSVCVVLFSLSLSLSPPPSHSPTLSIARSLLSFSLSLARVCSEQTRRAKSLQHFGWGLLCCICFCFC